MSKTSSTPRTLVGRILVGSALLMGVLAVLFYAGIVPVAEESRTTLALILGFAAVMDLALAVYFMSTDHS
jgi:hypothetical protein